MHPREELLSKLDLFTSLISKLVQSRSGICIYEVFLLGERGYNIFNFRL